MSGLLERKGKIGTEDYRKESTASEQRACCVSWIYRLYSCCFLAPLKAWWCFYFSVCSCSNWAGSWRSCSSDHRVAWCGWLHGCCSLSLTNPQFSPVKSSTPEQTIKPKELHGQETLSSIQELLLFNLHSVNKKSKYKLKAHFFPNNQWSSMGRLIHFF